MTFQEFQQSRVLVHISQETQFEDLYGDSGIISGFKYDDSCYIACLDDGSFELTISNWSESDRDLTKLERILWAQWYLHEQEGMTEKPVMLSVNDTTLDDFILAWCDYRGIECDGDLYGVLFSVRDTFTLSEAESILESHHHKQKAFGHSAVFGEKLGND